MDFPDCGLSSEVMPNHTIFNSDLFKPEFAWFRCKNKLWFGIKLKFRIESEPVNGIEPIAWSWEYTGCSYPKYSLRNRGVTVFRTLRHMIKTKPP